MNKKGFTLIELLAVILILGIIALIAIPTVNKIINEAREGAFKTSSDNIMKSAEQECQTQLIKGENPILSYTFLEGKINYPLEVKGTMPDDGYILLDGECSVTDFYLKDKNNVYSNGEDIRKNYMLQAPTEEDTSIFKTLYPSYYDNIVTVNFINNINVPEGAIEVKDPSISGNNKIKSWIIEDSGKYNLYIGSEKKIYGNYDSSYLFYNLNLAINITLTNFDSSFTQKMNNMFQNCNKLENIDISNFNTSNVANMSFMFDNCNFLSSLDVSNWQTRNVTSMGYMFRKCGSLTSLDVNNWDTSNVSSFAYMFKICGNLNLLDVSNWDTSSAKNMREMFYGCSSLTSLDVSNWNTVNVTNMQSLFNNCQNISNLNLSNWNINNVSSMNDILNSCNNLNNITIADANVLNKLASYLPTRTAEAVGTIIIIGEKTGLQTDILNSKYWNIA